MIKLRCMASCPKARAESGIAQTTEKPFFIAWSARDRGGVEVMRSRFGAHPHYIRPCVAGCAAAVAASASLPAGRRGSRAAACADERDRARSAGRRRDYVAEHVPTIRAETASL